MIEEIKKLKTYEIESEVIVVNKHYVSNIKTINLESVIEILDKYNNQIEQLEDKINTIVKYCKSDDEYWGNDSYINGKNEENREVKNDILSILGE